MEITADIDFNDIFWEPPETEFQPLLDFEKEVQDEVPHNDISLLTQRIKRSFLDYVRQGIMLDAVRRYRLYKRSYRDFAEYCKLALGRSPFYCKRIIEAAQICLRLIKAKFKILPTSVAQALPLLKFAKVDEYGESQLQDKWQTVINEYRPESITAIKIQETLDENPEGRPKQVRIGASAYLILQKKAVEAGIAVSEYLEMLIRGESPNDEPPPDDDDKGTELTAEKEAICDRAEAYVKQAEEEAICDRAEAYVKQAEAYVKKAKPVRRGFAIKKPSSDRKAISSPTGRSDCNSDSS